MLPILSARGVMPLAEMREWSAPLRRQGRIRRGRAVRIAFETVRLCAGCLTIRSAPLRIADGARQHRARPSDLHGAQNEGCRNRETRSVSLLSCSPVLRRHHCEAALEPASTQFGRFRLEALNAFASVCEVSLQ